MPVYIPQISDYAPFYIQRGSDATATNILTSFGVIVKDSGYPMTRKAKEPYKNDWKDRDGDDEWNNTIHYAAFTYQIQCAIFTRNANGDDAARAELKAAVRAFQNFIKNGEFKFFSSYHKFGFQKVRIEEFTEPGASAFATFGDTARIIFPITLKVNDPTTDMVYNASQNKIVAE